MNGLKLKWLELKNAALDKWDDIRANPRKLLITSCIVFFVLGVGVGYMNRAEASVTFHQGETLTHSLSVCLKLEDAKAVASAKTHEKAAEIFNGNAQCAEITVIGPQVGKVVFKNTMERDGKKVSVKVVEILESGKVAAYFLTSLPVNERPLKGMDGETIILKPERNG